MATQTGLLEQADALEFYNLLDDKAKASFNSRVRDHAGLLTDGAIQDKHLVEAMRTIKSEMIEAL